MAPSSMVGIGFRPQHHADLVRLHPGKEFQPGWLEIHPENYLMEGGGLLAALCQVAERWPLSFHSVGLSPGSSCGDDRAFLTRMLALYRRFNPCLFSVHLAWSTHDSSYFNDLLPMPLTYETLDVVVRNVDVLQQALGRPILIENPSSYLWFRHSVIPEPEFLAALVHRTGCRLLLDLNNVVVSCHNMGLDYQPWMRSFPLDLVEEIHVAGHHQTILDDGRTLKIDDHGSRVSSSVWDLLRQVVAIRGVLPVLVEWDTNIPPLATLLDEAAVVQDILLQEDARACLS
ncbi:DUF692 domain-containing protein [Haematospirillum sp. H1815]|uniref:MNIO family bufferin maturase n=1 Tax=Haematospirillum sp. H1815 TaxID=2723108 RepID=UPI001ADDF00C|nr:DUF692 domain-containing protein [Haematospirillum sp. H1815]